MIERECEPVAIPEREATPRKAVKREYWQKLKDPRWQRRRLEIMQRDHFACARCLETENTLNVHHVIYRKGADPWQYDDYELTTLCEGCHFETHLYTQRILLLLNAQGSVRHFVEAFTLLEERYKECGGSDGDAYPPHASEYLALCARYPDLLAEARDRHIAEQRAIAERLEGALNAE
jgi:hypothetical protein